MMGPPRRLTHCMRSLGLVGLVVLLGACGEAHVVSQTPDYAPAPRVASNPAPRHAGTGEVEVVRGDTLYGVAFRNGMDFRELAAINGVEPPYTIYVGQVLKLRGSHPQAIQAAPHPPHPTSPPSGAVHPAPSGFVNVPSATDSDEPSIANPSPPVRPTTGPANMSSPTPVPHVAAHVAETPSAAILPAVIAPAGGFGWHWPAKGALLERFMAGDATKQGIDIAGSAGDPVLAAGDGVVVYSGSGLVGYGELIIIKHSDEWLSAYGHNRKRLVQEGQRVRAGQPIAEMGSSGAPRDELHFEIRRNGRPVDPLQYLPAR